MGGRRAYAAGPVSLGGYLVSYPLRAEMLQLPEPTIRDAVEDVFAAHEYNRTSLLMRAVGWVADQLRRAFDTIRLPDNRLLYYVVIGIVALAALLVVSRVIYALWLRSEGGQRTTAAAARRTSGDPWASAQELAARGEYTDAAHSLYQALLVALARRQQIRLHPSKTVGDYARELRYRSSSAFARFREFGRSYEWVIYGVGSCDRERYEKLYELAAPVVEQRG